jgi:alkyl hydroperoxide reductase subunit AhpC
LAAFEKAKPELEALGIKVAAASVDPLDKAKETAVELSYPLGYGVTRDIAERIGAWWEERRGIVQPSEFVVDTEGKVRASTYSSGPIGRIDPGDVIRLVQFYDRQAGK